MQQAKDHLSAGDLAGAIMQGIRCTAPDHRSSAARLSSVPVDVLRRRRVRNTQAGGTALRSWKLSPALPRQALAASLAIFMIVSPAAAMAGAAADQLRQSVEKIQKILSDPALKDKAKAETRRQQLREALSERFDFGEMARRSLGAQWSKRSEAEQKEFVRLFTELLEGAYLSRLEEYSGEQVRYVAERAEKDFAEVDTRIVNKKGEEFSLDYRLANQNGQWKIVDVVIENISVVNNYRSQFARVLSKSSFEELVQTMKQKKPARPGASG